VATKAAIFDALLEKYAPALAREFRNAIADVAKTADIGRMKAALEVFNIEGAIAAVGLDPLDFGGFEELFRTAFIDAGRREAADMPKMEDNFGNPVRQRFSAGHQVAADWLREHGATMLSEVVEDSKAAMRATMARGLQEGRNPASIVPEVVGRINRATGRREGGVLGLTSDQERYANNAQVQLASGDPEQMRAYLTRERRDKRFDRTIAKAIREGTPVPADKIEAAVRSYRNRLLALRAQTVGRTETMTALNKGAHSAWEQGVADGTYVADRITKDWQDAHDIRVRHDHAALGARKPIPFNEPFRSPNGDLMMFPMDRSLGARSKSIVGCRCWCRYSYANDNALMFDDRGRIDFFKDVA
jgi:hypothetical protein